MREQQKKNFPCTQEKTIESAQEMISEFIFAEHTLKKADAILIPGSNEGMLAVHAAELYKNGYAPIVIPSGKYSILKGKFLYPAQEGLAPEQTYETESDYLSAVLISHGVPREAVWQEREATYTYENAILTRKLLDGRGINLKKAIICCQAYHARRCLMYYRLLFPDTELLVHPVVTKGICKENWFLEEEKIDAVLGEMERCGSQFHEIFKEKRKGKEKE
ncbi:MAG: YdcF family protein [Eubacteriales bacterium]|nr:YdcF family protein [Eubacteriales bacterium]